jgi:hypothetical protein
MDAIEKRARLKNTVERVNALLKSEGVAPKPAKVKLWLESYFRNDVMVAKWKREGRPVRYFDLQHRPMTGHLFKTNTKAAKDAAKRLEDALRALDAAVSHESLARGLRPGVVFPNYTNWIEAWTRLAHEAATKKLSEKDVPKEPEKFYAAQTAAGLLVGHGLPVRAWKNSKKPLDERVYGLLVEVAAAIFFNEPVSRRHCEEMYKACVKVRGLAKQGRLWA